MTVITEEEMYVNKYTDDPRFKFFYKLFDEIITMSEISVIEHDGKEGIFIRSLDVKNYKTEMPENYIGIKQKIEKIIQRNKKKINKYTKIYS
jgi:hypothetical protein